MKISRIVIRNYFLFILFSLLVVGSIGPISAITDFDAPPIAEEEKEQEDTQQIWIYAIVIMVIIIAIRIVFQIIKKRKQQSDDEFST